MRRSLQPSLSSVRQQHCIVYSILPTTCRDAGTVSVSPTRTCNRFPPYRTRALVQAAKDIEYDGSRALRPQQLRCTGTARLSTAHGDGLMREHDTHTRARCVGYSGRHAGRGQEPRTRVAGYFGVTSHQQQATRSGFARIVAGPTRRRGTPAPVASGEKVEGEHTGPCLFELVVRARPGGRALDHVLLSPSADAQVQGICTDEVARYWVRRNVLMLRWAWVIHVDGCVTRVFVTSSFLLETALSYCS